MHICVCYIYDKHKFGWRERRKEKEGLGTEEFRSICSTYAKGLDIGGRIRIRIKRKMI